MKFSSARRSDGFQFREQPAGTGSPKKPVSTDTTDANKSEMVPEKPADQKEANQDRKVNQGGGAKTSFLSKFRGSGKAAG